MTFVAQLIAAIALGVLKELLRRRDLFDTGYRQRVAEELEATAVALRYLAAHPPAGPVDLSDRVRVRETGPLVPADLPPVSDILGQAGPDRAPEATVHRPPMG